MYTYVEEYLLYNCRFVWEDFDRGRVETNNSQVTIVHVFCILSMIQVNNIRTSNNKAQ